ncbi:MAG: SUMF1/EgtB/PvdO family nonheme iron enzyme [Candidatus Delongbacteria bacterium]|nr:SUMF1/EgtB/PvdO family nonheme iron enzyme [Candidatus Delongbacteria bacterium]MCG2759793.1 SUMF1/EgtB/PvdO family nonheme iron enzyme [Candidatus Delongbacteria bacterium]
MKTKLIFLLLILTGFLFAQAEKGISIKSQAGNEGKRWAICVGINDYDDKGILDLKKAQNDAEALGAALKDYGQFDYVYKMTDKNDPRSDEYPSLRKLRSKLKYLKGFLSPEDLVVFSFSGHGVSNKNGESYLVLSDSDPNDIYSTSLKLKEVTDILKTSGVKKSLLLVDACREVLQENKGINQNGLKAEKFEKSEVAATFYATKDGWFSYEDDKGEFGAFTKYVLKGIEGEADNSDYQGNGDGIVTFTELASFVEDGVTDWALSKGKQQRPYTQINGEKFGDLALASYKGVQLNRKSTSSSEGVSSDFIFVQGGTFQMGGTESDEKPVHSVTVGDFYIGKYEVTQAQYQAVMGKNPSNFKGDNLPVESVTWNDAVEYCRKLSQKEGVTYRLPTEAEWEYAARGGNQSRAYEYSGSSNIDEVAWQSGDKWGSLGSTKSVGGKKPNEIGIYDMSGNVWEWCSDWYGSDYYRNSPSSNPAGPSTGSSRVLRGGSWSYYPVSCRVAYRGRGNPTNSGSYSGFRVVRLP